MQKPLIPVLTITSSDTRTAEDDEGGRLLGELLRQGGMDVLGHAIVREDPGVLATRVRMLCDAGRARAIVITGGTGLGPRDRVPEEIAPLLDKTLDGFGELFRQLSFAEIGPRAMLSRAVAGVSRGTLIYALPGSPKALRLAVERLIVPTIGHAVALLAGHTAHGGGAS